MQILSITLIKACYNYPIDFKLGMMIPDIQIECNKDDDIHKQRSSLKLYGKQKVKKKLQSKIKNHETFQQL